MDSIVFLIAGVSAVGGLVIGTIVTFLIMKMTRKDPGPTEQQEEESAWVKDGYQPTVNLWLHRERGKLATEIGGKMVVDPHKLSQRMRKGMIRLAEEWLRWLTLPGDFDLTKSFKKNREQPLPEPEKKPQAGVKPEAIKTVIQAQAVPMEVKPPTILSSLVRQTRPQEDDAIPEDSMVDQINEILQEILANSPLADRGISLIDDPIEGVVVLVGLEKYEGINAVPDKEILAMIQKAVAIWEKRI